MARSERDRSRFESWRLDPSRRRLLGSLTIEFQVNPGPRCLGHCPCREWSRLGFVFRAYRFDSGRGLRSVARNVRAPVRMERPRSSKPSGSGSSPDGSANPIQAAKRSCPGSTASAVGLQHRLRGFNSLPGLRDLVDGISRSQREGASSTLARVTTSSSRRIASTTLRRPLSEFDSRRGNQSFQRVA